MADLRNKLNQLRTSEGISLSKLSKKLKDEYDISVSPSQLNYYERKILKSFKIKQYLKNIITIISICVISYLIFKYI